jgi:hypothetical protein
MSSVNLAALTTNLGAYYRENRDVMFTQMLLDLDGSLADCGINVMDDVVDEVPLPNLSIENFLRPGDGASNNNKQTFSPTADAIVFDSRMLKAYPVMGDLKIEPWKFERTWLSHNRRGKASYKDWQDVPFYEWIAREIVKKSKEQIRKATFQGVRNTAGTSFLDICDGLLEVRKQGITATLIPTVETGAITASNVVASIEKVAKAIGDGYAEQEGYMPVNRTIYDWYVTADETQFGRSMQLNELVGGNGQQSKSVYIRGTAIKLVKEPAMGASQVLTVYTADNLWAGTDTLNNLNNMDFEKFERSIKVMIDFKWGLNFGMLHATAKPVVTNDVDLPE